jgi:hypothetical protein
LRDIQRHNVRWALDISLIADGSVPILLMLTVEVGPYRVYNNTHIKATKFKGGTFLAILNFPYTDHFINLEILTKARRSPAA